MQKAQVHHFYGAPGHCSLGLATSDEWGCSTLFYSLRKPAWRSSSHFADLSATKVTP